MKSTIINVVFALLAIVVFNAVAFLPPIDHTDAFWTSYVCCWVVVIVSFALNMLSSIGTHNGERILFGFPLFYVTGLYFIVGIVLDLALLITAALPTWAIALVNIALVVLLAAGYVTSGVAREYIEEQGQIKTAQMSFATTLRSQTEALAVATATTSLAAETRALNDAARFSDPVSSPELSSQESMVLNLVYQAITAFNAGDEARARTFIAQAKAQLEQRNCMVKASK